MKKIFTSSPLSLDFGLLLLRVLLAAGLLTHGIAKIANFSALSTSFLDPLGIGVLPALLGAIFAEVVCSILVLIGLWTRLTVLPLIFTFIVVFFVVSGGAARLRARWPPALPSCCWTSRSRALTPSPSRTFAIW